MKAGLFIIALWMASFAPFLTNGAIINYIRLFDGGKTDLKNGKPNGKACHEWQTRVTNGTKFLNTCFDPTSAKQQCYLERVQFKPNKEINIENLVLTMDYDIDFKLCTGRCGLETSLLVYYKLGKKPEQLKNSIQGSLIRNKVTKVYRFKYPKLINALYFRITPVDYCGTIHNVRLFVGETLCASQISGLVQFPSSVNGKL